MPAPSKKAIASAISSPVAVGAFYADASGTALAINGVNGYLKIQLSLPSGSVASLTGGGEVAATEIFKITLDANGIPTDGQTMWMSDQFSSPANPGFNVEIHNGNDRTVGTIQNAVISGAAPVDLTTLTGTNNGVSYPGAVLLNPGADQSILSGNLSLNTAKTLNVNNIKQQAGAALVVADPNGVSHFFISSSAPYTNTFVNGSGSGNVFLGSAAKASVADTTGTITSAGSLLLQTTSQTLGNSITNDGAGGFNIVTNAGKGWQIVNANGQLQGFVGASILMQGATSGSTVLQPSAIASGTLTLPATTGTLSVVTMTLKKGSGGGNYTSTSLSAVQVDGTNLSYTVTIPTGWKLSVQASGSIGSNTAAVTVAVSITDGGSKLQEVTAIGPVAGGLVPFSLSSVINGDGASHTIDMRFFTTNASDAVAILNASGTQLPTMIFNLSPSN